MTFRSYALTDKLKYEKSENIKPLLKIKTKKLIDMEINVKIEDIYRNYYEQIMAK